MSLLERCPLRKSTLPRLPCDCTSCSWYVNKLDKNNCFWCLADDFDMTGEMTVEEIAQIENISVEEVEKIIAGALSKLRNTWGRILQVARDD